MKKVKLGSSDLQVSEVCLGSMTWGEQNTQTEGHQQIDYALDQGINFIDTAEMYSVPPSKETYGATEAIIGNWIAANKSKRQDIVLASKIAGRTGYAVARLLLVPRLRRRSKIPCFALKPITSICISCIGLIE
jgi:aryl-alcohol dehydrogenase-like predicted oxidoreductase